MLDCASRTTHLVLNMLSEYVTRSFHPRKRNTAGFPRQCVYITANNKSPSTHQSIRKQKTEDMCQVGRHPWVNYARNSDYISLHSSFAHPETLTYLPTELPTHRYATPRKPLATSPWAWPGRFAEAARLPGDIATAALLRSQTRPPTKGPLPCPAARTGDVATQTRRATPRT